MSADAMPVDRDTQLGPGRSGAGSRSATPSAGACATLAPSVNSWPYSSARRAACPTAASSSVRHFSVRGISVSMSGTTSRNVCLA